MIITYNTFDYRVNVSIDGTSFSKEKFDFSDQEKSNENANPLLKKVKEYQDKEWELMNFHSTIYFGTSAEIFYGYLRKKKTDKNKEAHFTNLRTQTEKLCVAHNL